MKHPVLKALVYFIGTSAVTALAATPPTPTLQKADKPLIDLGSELGGSTGVKSTKPSSYSPPKKSYSKPSSSSTSYPEKNSSKPAMVDQANGTADKTAEPVMPKTHWSYSGDTGPRHWGDLAPENIQCKAGKNQSPIDLRDKHGVGTSGLPELEIRYRDVPLKVINTGNTLQVNYPLGSYIKLGTERYELMNFQFKTPSEHKKEGFNYPMEVQLVHQDGDGNVAMIGIIFQEGEENEHLQTLLDNLPKEINKQEIHKETNLNPVMFFPGNTDFYKYSGSLTTPPCSEGVYWMVFKHTIEASAEQIQQMNEVMGENSRPVQEANSRTLLKSWMEQMQEPPMYEFY